MASAAPISKEEEAEIQRALAELRGLRKPAEPAEPAEPAAAPTPDPLAPPADASPSVALPSVASPVVMVPAVPVAVAPAPAAVAPALAAAARTAAEPMPRLAPVQPNLAAAAASAAIAMPPETQARIAMLLEQEADQREARRAQQRRMVWMAGGVGALMVLAVIVATSFGTPAKKSGAPTAAVRPG